MGQTTQKLLLFVQCWTEKTNMKWNIKYTRSGVFHQNHLKVGFLSTRRGRDVPDPERKTQRTLVQNQNRESSGTKAHPFCRTQPVWRSKVTDTALSWEQTGNTKTKTGTKAGSPDSTVPISSGVQHRWTVWHWQMDRLTDEWRFCPILWMQVHCDTALYECFSSFWVFAAESSDL